MAKQGNKEYIKINFPSRRRDVEALLRMVTFEDGDFQIAYIPSLNLSGYGNNEEDAVKMLCEVVVKDYLTSLSEMPESKVMTELREYGWKRLPFLSKQLQNTKFFGTDAIKETFNLPAETQFHERFVTA